MKKYLPLFITVGIVSAFLTYFILSFIKPVKTPANPVAKPTVYVEKKLEKPLGKSAYNVLLLGYGGAGHDGGNLSDLIMVAHVDPVNTRVTFISVPRDLWVEIPVRSDMKQNFKINAAYAIGWDDRKYPLKEPQYKGENGAALLAKKVVGEVTGLPIDNIVAVDFGNFKNIVDTLGGIEVEVPVTFDDYLYPVKGLENEVCGFSAAKIQELHSKYSGFDLEKQFTCRYEHLHFDKGVSLMNGESALKFVRSRHSLEDGGDFARSRRQKAVILALRKKLISLNAVKKSDELFNEFKGFVRTDLNTGSALKWAEYFGSPEPYRTKFIGLNEENVLMATKSLDGQFILIPKQGENIWSGVQKYIYDEISRE